MNELILTTLEEAESAFRQIHERYDPLMRFHARLGIPVPKVLQTAAEFDLNQQLRRVLREEPPPAAEIEARLREAHAEGVTFDESTLMAFRDAIERASVRFRERPDDLEQLDALEALVGIVRRAGISVDIRRAQNRYYRMRSTVRPAIEASAGNGESMRTWLELFDSLGSDLAMAPQPSRTAAEPVH